MHSGGNKRKYEKLHTRIYQSSLEASAYVASEIASLIRTKALKNQSCIIGLATGSTPKTVYQELVRMHKEEGLSFRNVISFNLDEYYPMEPGEIQSYVRFMNEHLFDHIDIPKSNINIPNGTIDETEVVEYCQSYENKIDKLGGLDLQILGIGRTGHIGFNEPGSDENSMTRLITLDQITRIDAASDFFGEENVPSRAITMGVGTILKARRILLLAWGEGKSSIIRETVEGRMTESIPSTYLHTHKNTEVILDQASSSDLTRVESPWLVTRCEWTDNLVKKAVIWLSQRTEKAILKLTDRDYAEHGLGDLIAERNGAYSINLMVFNELQRTITGWPGGKPNVDDTYRPERAFPASKKVIIFSPHPDDDVISMGGTFKRLVDQHHEVHVAYQTSGNIAVFNEHVLQLIDLVDEIEDQILEEKKTDLFKSVKKDIQLIRPGYMDSEMVRMIKGIIRKSESRAACRYVGVPREQIHFMELPFYESGLVEKNPVTLKDIDLTIDLLNKIKPHQIFAAGDLSDPHGTHRVCLHILMEAISRCKQQSWINDCYVWLYRGAWQEWRMEDIDMAVPLSPDELFSKRKAIFKHQSQKDAPLFPGPDSREFWQRAEARNRRTAQLYNKLGLAEYEAIEAFRRYHF